MTTEDPRTNSIPDVTTSFSLCPSSLVPLNCPAQLATSLSPSTAALILNSESPLSGTLLQHLPVHVQHLLVKGRISPIPCCLSPYRCVLTRHPIHRDATETHIASLVARIRENGFDESLSSKSPLIAVRYTKVMAIPTKAAGSSRTMVQQSWGDHPLVYVISGAGRGEAIGQLVQKEPDNPKVKDQQKGLGFYLINCGENLSPWDIFLLSTSLNSVDPNSRPPNYFERTDQIAFICLELSNRKEADATVRDIAVEICFNPFLIELRQYLNLSPSIIPLHPIADSKLPPKILQELIRSRSIFPYLPSGMGVLVSEIPLGPLEVLDVLIDMATCVNSDRMKRVTPEIAQAKQRESIGNHAAPAKTEGFLHARAEDQLRHLFKEIVPLESASTLDVLVLRDLVGVVFGAIQECSRQFRQTNCSSTSEESKSGTSSQFYSATNPLAAAYWIERLVHEACPGGILAGLWNFPAAALVILFYIYFVNKIQQYNKLAIQENILKLGTILYRCIAELSLSLRASNVTLMHASTAIQVRVLEAAAMLFRMAFFGTVKVQVFPPHPYSIPPTAVAFNAHPLLYDTRTFSEMDTLYEFLYSYWLRGIIVGRLPATMEYREGGASAAESVPAPAAAGVPTAVPAVSTAGALKQQQPPRAGGEINSTHSNRRVKWYESKRLDVAATANRLRQEVETIISGGVAGQQPPGVDKVRVKRLGGKRGVPGSSSNTDTSAGTNKLLGSVEVEVLDPSILPMAQPARLEFLSLVFGVTSMLIEKHQCLETATTTGASTGRVQHPVQVLNVPANMIVLAAIKVALSLIPPHFDRLAPCLVHWVDVRCKLIEWMWRTAKDELCRRAEERWTELWTKRNKHQPAPKLEVRFTSLRQDGGPSLQLTLAKLSGLVPEIVPGVLESMTAFYEERSDMPDDKVIRDFFSKWLKSGSGEVDLITQVNQLLLRPTPASGVTEHVSKRPRFDHPPHKPLEIDYLRVSHPPALSGPVNDLAKNVSSQAGGSGPLNSKAFGPSDYDHRASKQRSSKRPFSNRQVDGNEELADWLETLPYTEKLRLNALELPEWEIPTALDTSPSDLLRWKPPEVLHSFSGNGLRGPAFDPNEVFRMRQQQAEKVEATSSNPTGSFDEPSGRSRSAFYQPISDLDWKITEAVLRLLRSRGIDTLVSRTRGQIFFLDHLGVHPSDTGGRENIESSSMDGEDPERRKKKQRTLVDTVAQKRYGSSFFKPTDPPDYEREISGRLFDLDNVRSFLEYENLFSISSD